MISLVLPPSQRACNLGTCPARSYMALSLCGSCRPFAASPRNSGRNWTLRGIRSRTICKSQRSHLLPAARLGGLLTQRLSEYAPAVDRLFDKAGTNQVFVSTRFAGKSITYCLGMKDYRGELDETFKQTIGVYKFRIRNSFNPVYWAELPGRISLRWKWSSSSLLRLIFSAVFWAFSIAAAWFAQKMLDALLPGLPSMLESILR